MNNKILGTIYYPSGSLEVLYEWNEHTLYTIHRENGERVPLYTYNPTSKMMEGINCLSEPLEWDGSFLSTITQDDKFEQIQKTYCNSVKYWRDKDTVYKDKDKEQAICGYEGLLPSYIFDLPP